MTEEESKIPTLVQYTHSLKISDTSKGVRFDVHVYANSSDEVIDQAFIVYLGAIERAAKLSIPMADQNGNGVIRK